ncbi:MAG: FG-GAP repeat domain-containing protein [Chloroflexaceae bacterium]
MHIRLQQQHACGTQCISRWFWFVPLLALLLGLGILVIVPPDVQADDPAFFLRRAFGPTADSTEAVALGDVDGDGHLDLVVGNGIGLPGLVYLNDSRGNFYNGPVDCATPPAGVRCLGDASRNLTAVALGDIDGDADLDIVTGYANAGNASIIYLNDGTGQFHSGPVACGTTPDVRCFGDDRGGIVEVYAVALGDLDGRDGLDIALGLNGGQNAVFFNDGDGGFFNGTLNCNNQSSQVQCFGVGYDSTWSLALGDLDGQNGLDIVVGNHESANLVFFNDGTGTFANGPLTCGATANVACLGVAADKTSGIALGDIDGDQDLDILASNTEAQNTLYRNAGNGTFATDERFGNATDPSLSLAPADLDSDGDLDVIVGNQDRQSVVYLNDGTGDLGAAQTFGSGTGMPSSVTAGDLDSDGDLDVIVGNRSLQNEIYVNNGAGSFAASATRPFGGASDRNVSIATGDMNDDGYLDLVVGKLFQQHALYLNDGAGAFTSASFGNPAEAYQDLAVADIDGDDDLDIVVAANGGQNAVFLNDGTGSFHTGGFVCGVTAGVHCFGTGADATASVVPVDLNGDEHLDIVVGNAADQQNVVYLNDGSGRFDTGPVVCADSPDAPVRCLGTGDDTTRSIAVGDIDRDSDPDLLVGNEQQPNTLYLNDGAANFTAAVTVGSGLERTQQVALSDLDGDGSLDIIVGNSQEQNAVYLNDGAGNFAAGPVICGERDEVKCFGSGLDTTRSLVLADIDGDGDNDIVTGNSADQSAVYLNDGRGNFPFRRSFGTDDDPTAALTVADLDYDGDLDLVVGMDDAQSRVYRNGLTGPARLALPQAVVLVSRPGSTPDAEGFATPRILSEQVIPIRYDLDAPVGMLRAFYSPDGGGRWLAANTPDGTNLVRNPQPDGDGRYTFAWDTFASGFFGQSDNVVFRLEAYPVAQISSVGLPGPFQRPYLAAQTFPFRVRGTQVQVVCEGCDGAGTTAAADALVYRLPAGEVRGAQPIAAGNQAGEVPFRTDPQGFLQGRGELAVNDHLVALAPISATETYTLYYTNATPTVESLDAATVTQAGVQQLTVSSENPLVRFNLEVSLEWDARSDAQYLARLREDFRRTGAILFDWTDGQAALGDITIYHDRERWNDAHIRVYATNRLRPNANQGGIITTPLSETVMLNDDDRTITYDPGQVRMGAVWNRYGESSGTIGEDWPRTLAHELGHYALFLDDNYIGLEGDLLVPVRDCPGAMSDPYIENYSEFHPTADWLPGCAQTLSNQNSGRSDWATITAFYSDLDAPAEFNANPGPAILPLELTRTRFVAPGTPDDAPETLEVPIIYLTDDSGGAVQPEPDGRAFLFQQDKGRLLDLGRTVLDRVDARGARAGDRLCVYNLEQNRLGCEELRPTDQQLQLTTLQQPWQPELVITPVTSRTVTVAVREVAAGLTLRAQIYPLDYPALEPITLTENGNQYTGTFELAEPAFTGYVHVWVAEAEPRREVVGDYSIGGNPGSSRNRHIPRNNPGSSRNRHVPVLSGDGQAILYTLENNFAVGEFYALQSTRVIDPLPWANVVGQAYRLTATPNAPQLAGNASISIGYLTDEVVPGEEQWIRVYYRQDAGWRQLETTLDTELNMAAAPTQGPGVYALMSTIEFPLEKAGWNPLPYPVQEEAPRPLPAALRSIEDRYTTVYGYYPTETQPWRLYDADAPAWLNNSAEFGLTTLEFGRGYWIRVTEPLTVSFQGGQTRGVTRDEPGLTEVGIPYPPATYYAELQPDGSFVPQSGMLVTTRIGDTVCGESTVQEVDGKLVFVLHVASAVEGEAECGLPERRMRIAVGSSVLWEGVTWDNDRPGVLPWPVNTPDPVIYLPLVQR